jgi:hypothetical protein
VSAVGGLQIKPQVKPGDPLLHDIELPLSEVCFPLGFPLVLATNSREVLQAAAESWGIYTSAEFNVPPLEIRVVVRPGGEFTSTPVYRGQGHLFSIVSDSCNFAVYDGNSLSGYCFVSESTAQDRLGFRFHYLEGMVYSLLAQRYLVPIHAGCIARGAMGILLCGESGSGKSTLAFGCARAGFTYVADDCTWLLPDGRDRLAIGKSHIVRLRHDAPRLFPEIGHHAAIRRPNGRFSIELALAEFPAIATSRRAVIGHMVTLDRRAGATPRLYRISSEEIVDRLLLDQPSYGEEITARYAQTVGQLADVPAFRMQYDTVESALVLLTELSD